MDLDAIDLVVLATVGIAYAVVSGRLARAAVSSAIFFLTLGIVLGDLVLGWFVIDADGAALRLLAEATLALVLFSDASRIDVRLLRREVAVPARLLGIGLPLTIVAGTLVALVLLPSLAPIEAVLLAIAVAPTDAALGQVVVTDERVPSRIRQGLNVESGLNDGLCVPLLLIALTFAAAEGGGETEPIRLIVEEIGFGIVGGLAAGAVGAAGLRIGLSQRWVDPTWAPIVPIAVAGLAYGLATVLHGSGLIAAFAAGLTFGTLATTRERQAAETMETIGAGLSAVTFFVAGTAIVPIMVEHFSLGVLAFAVAAVTVARMVPVALALLGTGIRPPTVAYVGWFGPRGLASIVFAVLIVQAGPLPGLEGVLAAITLTIILSVYAHGVTARPLTDRYVAWVHAHPRRAQLAEERSA